MCKAILCRELTVTVVSATNVEDVRNFRKTKLYAKVTVGSMDAKTDTDTNNETNPYWNTTFKFTIPSDYVHNPNYDLNLEIEICLDSILRKNQRVGYATQNIYKLFADGCNDMRLGLMTCLTLPLVADSELIKGEVTLEYFFGDQQYFRNLCLAKKAANIETSLAVRTGISSATGVHISIPIRVFEAPEIVTLSGLSTSDSGEAIAVGLSTCGIGATIDVGSPTSGIGATIDVGSPTSGIGATTYVGSSRSGIAEATAVGSFKSGIGESIAEIIGSVAYGVAYGVGESIGEFVIACAENFVD